MVARPNFLAQDRTDIQFAVKEACRRMANPRIKDLTALKRVVRFVKGISRLVHLFRRQELPKEITIWTDTNFAGCEDTRKSTSGGVVRFGCHMLKSWSSTQSLIALSSGEAE